MYKMVIADDERLIRESLHLLMDWESIDVEVVGVAADGSEALELIHEHAPHILLSDISMHQMDGIQLIRMISEQGLSCQVIFLSAYSDFAYAQSALKYGAFDYILKPIDENELLDTVVRCIEAIKQKEKDTPKQNENADSMHLNTALKNMLISAGEQDEQSLDVLSQLGIMPGDERFCIGSLLPMHPADKTKELNAPDTSDTAETEIQFVVNLSDDQCLLLWVGSAGNPNQLAKQFFTYHRSLDPALQGVYISDPHTLDELSHIYAECTFAQLYPKLGFDTSSHRFSDASVILKEHYPKISADDVSLAIHKNDIATIKSLIDAMFWRFAQRNQIYDTNTVKLRCIELLDSLKEDLYMVDEASSESENGIMITAKRLINIQTSVYEIYTELFASLQRFCTFVGSVQNVKGTSLVAQAVALIKENYQDISLAAVAQKLYVSPTYLSRVFAAEKNDTFSRYVQKYRMKVAKKLLLDPQYKIYNIAKMVGYSNVAHFSKAFKQLEGISPMKYKNISTHETETE